MSGGAAASEGPGCREVSDPVRGDRLEFVYEPAQMVTGEWTAWHRERYDAKGAVSVRIGEAKLLEFVRDLPGLRSVWVIDPLADDTPVFDVPSLEQLVLYTRCKKPLAADRLPELRDLIIDGRPGLESVRGHPSLRRLQVHGCGSASVPAVGVPPLLQELALHGKWRPLDLTGLTVLASLRALRITEATIDEISAIAACRWLQQVELNVRTSDRRPVDIAPLAALPDLRTLDLGRQPVRGLEALLGAPRLVDFRAHGGALAGDSGEVVHELQQQVRKREQCMMQQSAAYKPGVRAARQRRSTVTEE